VTRGSQYNASQQEDGATVYCIQEWPNSILLKDIHNITNHPQTDRSKNFETALQELQKAPG